MSIYMSEDRVIYLQIGAFVLAIPNTEKVAEMLCNGDFKEAYQIIKKLADKTKEAV